MVIESSTSVPYRKYFISIVYVYYTNSFKYVMSFLERYRPIKINWKILQFKRMWYNRKIDILLSMFVSVPKIRYTELWYSIVWFEEIQISNFSNNYA